MRLTIAMALVATTLLATFVPAPASAAADYCDTLNIERYCDSIPCHSVNECCNIKDGCVCAATGVCHTQAPEPYVRRDSDSVTVGYTACEYVLYSGTYCYDNDVVTIPTSVDPCTVPAACEPAPVDDLCFTYNPSALTNACVTTTSDSRAVDHPTVVPTERRTCVIGQEGCVTHAWATTGTGTTYVPLVGADGYVELTVACEFNVPCRLNL